MRFLEGRQLSKEMARLVSQNTKTKIAIAYWGGEALKLLGIDTKRRDIQVVCCLKGGKSAPEVIRKFRHRARQHDRLNAKVVWTPNGAIVGSANASSNGLPEEENLAKGLIEAGIYLTEKSQLKAIEKCSTVYSRQRLAELRGTILKTQPRLALNESGVRIERGERRSRFSRRWLKEANKNLLGRKYILHFTDRECLGKNRRWRDSSEVSRRCFRSD
jgi:hypothetical protein